VLLFSFRGCAAPLILSLAPLLLSCNDTAGTLHLSIVTAPNSDLMARASQIRLTLSDPKTVRVVDKQGGGFALDLDLTVAAQRATLRIEALDAASQVLAWGETPPLVLGPITADLAVFIAPAQTFATAPVAFASARSQMGVAGLSFGVLFVGGVDASGSARDDVTIYNAFTHAFQIGKSLPQPRVGPTVAANGTKYAYIVGGDDPAHAPAVSGWLYDTGVAPNGAYFDLSATLPAPLGQLALPLAATGTNRFVLSGPMAGVLDGATLRETAIAPAIGVPAQGATVISASVNAYFVGDRGAASAIVKVDAAGLASELPDIPSLHRTGHAVVARGADLLIVGGGATANLASSIVKVDTATMTATSFDAVLSPPRRGAAVALADGGRWLVVAGGTDATDSGPGTVLQTADVFDAATMMRVATVPLAHARTAASATTLANGQILLAGGVDATGAPIAELELFTPTER